MNRKGRIFKGIFGGAGYDRLAAAVGLKSDFYRKALGELDFPKGARILEIGCGTATMSITLAGFNKTASEIHCIDLSSDQLKAARNKAESLEVPFWFGNCSMDELDYPDGMFDLVIASMALHVTPPDVRRGAVRETARVLKDNGQFLLVDWSKPRFGIQAMIWFPFLFFNDWQDNWHNTYRAMCEKEGLVLKKDHYISSMIRRQLFKKCNIL